MTKLAIGIDLHRCIGCNTCALACKMQNNVPDDKPSKEMG